MAVKKKLLDIVREKIRIKHYSLSTERTYVLWIKQYIFFHNKKHPINMGKVEICKCGFPLVMKHFNLFSGKLLHQLI